MASNTDDRPLERRLAAVERAVTDEADDASPGTAPAREHGDVEQRLENLEARVDELDAALQAVRGFLGGIDAVNEAVESRADAAVAAVERLERQLDEAEFEPEAGFAGAERGAERQDPHDADRDIGDEERAEGNEERAERALSGRLRDRW
jgi:chromosome segregation ATPase